MKRTLALFLALLMALALCACGGNDDAATHTDVTTPPSEDAAAPTEDVAGQPLGTTQSTDILEFTLDRADFCIALDNSSRSMETNSTNYFLPKEYVAAEDSDNPYVAATGHTLVSFTYTIHNLDRTFKDLRPSITIGYGGETYKLSPKYGWSRTLGEDATYSEAGNMILDPDETLTRRGYVDIPVTAEFTDELDFTISLPNSAGEGVEMTYHVTQADRETCAEADRLAAEKEAEEAAAAEAERLAEADPEVAKAVRDFLQDKQLSYTEDGASWTITFRGDRVTIEARNAYFGYEEEGNFSVRKEVILLEMDNGCTPVLPYTYENGEVMGGHVEGDVIKL